MMKKVLFYFVAAALVLGAVSCSNQEMPEFVQDTKSQTVLSEDALEAIAVADEFLGRAQSRSGETHQVLYILNEAKSRSEASLPDTLAFVVNYPEKSGFAVVMNSDRPDRVLAFSETGIFSLDDEVVNEYFTSRIGSFMASTNGSIIVGPVNPGGPTLGYVAPFIVTDIYEDAAPYYDFVRQIYPGAYTGTSTVAIAKAMLHAKDKVENFYGATIYCKSIRNAYTGTASVDPFPSYSLSYAKNLIGPLLYNIGQAMGVGYEANNGGNLTPSYVEPIAAANFMRSLGYEVTKGVTTYNFADVYDAIGDGNVIIMTGKRYTDPDCTDFRIDYWVCDGRKNAYEGISNYVQYIHCSWGNSNIGEGYNAGYFRGTWFDYGDDDYYPFEYFAVKLEVKL